MILRRLPDPTTFTPADGVPSFADHCMFVNGAGNELQYPEHFTGLGMIALLNGNASFVINHSRVTMDENSFLVVNRGSTLSFRLQASARFCLLYFNTLLSDILSIDIFNKNASIPTFETASDFALLEHLHYQNATLKNQLTLLMDLGSSCASFHALKADMLIRSMLDDLTAENYEAMRASAKLQVVKKATRVDLFKRLQLARKWMEQNYSAQVNLRQVADIAMLNQEHFLRMFKQAYQQTPHQYLTQLRVDAAKLLLARSSEPVSTISQQVGFESLSSFSGLFKQKVGSTPGEFRKTGK